jgi:hypothetical protein
VTPASDEPTAQAQAIMERVLGLVTDCRSVYALLSILAYRANRECRGRAASLLHANERDRRGAHQDDGGCAPGPAARAPARQGRWVPSGWNGRSRSSKVKTDVILRNSGDLILSPILLWDRGQRMRALASTYNRSLSRWQEHAEGRADRAKAGEHDNSRSKRRVASQQQST